MNQVVRVDHDYVLRIARRADGFARFQRETSLLRSLAGLIPVPKLYAFGEYEGNVYQIQQFLPGQKLYIAWRDLSAHDQEQVMVDLCAALTVLHSIHGAQFGQPEDAPAASWFDFLHQKFQRTLADIRAYGFRIAPGFVEMAREYFEAHSSALQAGAPVLLHGDLTLVNLLVHEGRLSAILDLEYTLYAPPDYELWTLEAFCLYPNDWAEEDNEIFCAADYATLFPLLRKHAPALFETPHLRERMNLYQIEAALSSHIAWRKDTLSKYPPEERTAKEFYMARISNFAFRHGVRLFE